MSKMEDTHPALVRMRQFRAKRAADAQALLDQRLEFQDRLADMATQACAELNRELTIDRLKLGDVRSDHSKNIFTLMLLSDLGRSLTNSVKYKPLTFHLSVFDEVIVSAELPAFDQTVAFMDVMKPGRLRDIIVEYIAAAVEDTEA